MLTKAKFPRELMASCMALLLAAMLAGCAETPEPEGSAPATISAAALAERIAAGETPTILDVRTLEEYADGHVPGAISVPHDRMAERSGEFSAFRDSEVIVYCGSGKRAAMAQADLRAAGFSRVVDLEGHMQGWQAGGYPIE